MLPSSFLIVTSLTSSIMEGFIHDLKLAIRDDDAISTPDKADLGRFNLSKNPLFSGV